MARHPLFEDHVRRRGGWQQPVGQPLAGATFVIVNNHVRGGDLQVVQTRFHTSHSSGGDSVPFRDLVLETAGDLAGTVKNAYLTPAAPLFIPLDSEYLDWMHNEFIALHEYSYQLSPASIAAGASLADMTNATLEDQANVAAVNQMRGLLGMPALTD